MNNTLQKLDHMKFYGMARAFISGAVLSFHSALNDPKITVSGIYECRDL
ncbi:MAG: hypothetical protein H8D67_24370 [Deltaproteobacteria bacterium]|nr:hypothetical protein [Deltaproteobacteria bacterium]